MNLTQVLIFLGIAFQLCAGAKILVLVVLPSKSHYILLEPLIREYIDRGHEVTVITSFEMSKPPKELREIVIPKAAAYFSDKLRGKSQGDGKFSMRNLGALHILMLQEMGEFLADETMSFTGVQKLLKSDEKFDLILAVPICTEALVAGFSHRFQAPVIGVSTFLPNLWINELMGNLAPAAYVPESMLGFSNKMTFYERLVNVLFLTVARIAHYSIYLPCQEKLMRKYFGNDLPPLKEILSNTSLMLVNHHYSLAFPRPYSPNMIEIGSFHVKPPKPLPNELQMFMDEAKDGVIFFSMGTNLLSSEFPKDKFEGILRVFSKLKQKILWKFENENVTNLPQNVKISKWLPQSDILAHPNMKLFITHGGLLSLTESIFRGVPIVGIPIFGDQPLNVKLAEIFELGVSLKYEDIGETSLWNSINEVLNNPKYTNNVKLRSKILKDLQMPPLEAAIYWTEYVLRHKDSGHLRSRALDLAWYQIYMIDVLAFIGFILLIFMVTSLYIGKWLWRVICGKKGKKTVKQSKKKN